MNIRERVIEGYLRKKVRAAGGEFLKFKSTIAGVPDRIAIFPGGRIIFVELKTDEGDLSERQMYVIGRLENLGCTVDVIYGMEQAKEWAGQRQHEV